MPVWKPDQFFAEQRDPTDPLGSARTEWLSEPGALTQFGAAIETLAPGARSSLKHWHSSEDEFVYVLDGEATLIEGEIHTPLYAGDAATFRAGDPVGHCLVNRSDRPVRYLVVGTRAAVDRITYPDHERVCHRDRSAEDDEWFDLNGQPAASPYA